MTPFTVSTRCSVVLLMALAACGGGGDGSSTQPTQVPSGVDLGKPASPSNSTPSDAASRPSVPTATTPPPKLPENSTPPAPPTGGDPPPPSGPAPVSGSRINGAWSSVVDWPLLSIHAALLPDGRVMTYGTDINAAGNSRFMYDVFDPMQDPGSPASHLTLDNTTATNIFCSAQIVLPLSGELMLAGGDLNIAGKAQSRGNPDINLFDPRTNILRPTSQKMQRPRWYATATVLPKGDIYLQGGTDGEEHPEIRFEDGSFTLLKGIDTLKTVSDGHPYFDNNYPRNFVAPNGKIFGFDHHWMYQVDPYGSGDGGAPGSLTLFDAHWNIPNTRGGDAYRGWGASSTAVMYRPGKILQLGGSQANATIIDITGATPRLKDLPPLSQVRQWSNATVMPDGRVFVSGGSSRNLLNDPASQDVGQIALAPEIFDPATEGWSLAAPLSKARFYHSLTLLLPDATILSTGGGSPGPLTNLNAQIYYPGYLFRNDGSRATRPVIDQANGALPLVVAPSSTFQLTSQDAARIRRVTLVATGTVTHSFDMNQRFVEPSFNVSGTRIDVSLPANAYETPPGYYMVFVIDDAGTPSRARMIRINPRS